MNHIHMTSLAADHTHELRAEADRHRMAREAKPSPASSRDVPARRPGRIGLGWLLGRATA